jgi:hypothetical protein
LRQGVPTFLVWFADLDKNATEKFAKRPTKPVTGIDVSVLNQAPGANESLQAVTAKMRSVDRELREKLSGVDKELRDKFSAVERDISYIKVGATIAVGVLGAMVASWVNSTSVKPAAPQPPAGVTVPKPTPVPSQAPAKQQP